MQKRSVQNKFIEIAFNIKRHQAFIGFLILTVIINIIVLSVDHYPENGKSIINMELCNMYFTLVYFIEVWIKVTAIGVRSYLGESRFNIFDIIITLVSIVDILISLFFLTED